jgi:cold shock protein
MCVYRHFSIRVARASHIEGIPTRTMRVADWRNVMAVGTVKWFNTQKGYGFLQADDSSRDVFVHISAVERAGMTQLNEGQKIQYEVQRGQQGKFSAENLQPA